MFFCSMKISYPAISISVHWSTVDRPLVRVSLLIQWNNAFFKRTADIELSLCIRTSMAPRNLAAVSRSRRSRKNRNRRRRKVEVTACRTAASIRPTQRPWLILSLSFRHVICPVAFTVALFSKYNIYVTLCNQCF